MVSKGKESKIVIVNKDTPYKYLTYLSAANFTIAVGVALFACINIPPIPIENTPEKAGITAFSAYIGIPSIISFIILLLIFLTRFFLRMWGSKLEKALKEPEVVSVFRHSSYIYLSYLSAINFAFLIGIWPYYYSISAEISLAFSELIFFATIFFLLLAVFFISFFLLRNWFEKVLKTTKNLSVRHALMAFFLFLLFAILFTIGISLIAVSIGTFSPPFLLFWLLTPILPMVLMLLIFTCLNQKVFHILIFTTLSTVLAFFTLPGFGLHIEGAIYAFYILLPYTGALFSAFISSCLLTLTFFLLGKRKVV